MGNSGEYVELEIDLSEDNIPESLLDAIKDSGMSPEAYISSAIENVRNIATLLRSCVDLYEDKKSALEYLEFSFVAGVTVSRGVDLPTSVTQVMCGDFDGILHSLKNLLKGTYEDVFKGAYEDVYKDPFEG